MFSNRFNSKNDPLLEAAEAAMRDGDLRRQAEGIVNEAFGVYNRNAVVNEHKADYDAAIEDVYYFMKEDIDFEFILEGEDDDYAKKYAGAAKPTGVDREGGSSRRKRLTARAKIRQKMGPGKIKVSPEGISHTKRGKEMGDYDTTNYFDRKGNKVGRNTATIEVEREEYDARLEEAYGALKEGVQLDELYGKGRLKDIKHARSKETYKAMKKAEKASDVEHDERGYRTGPSREDKAYGAAKHREEKADMVAQKLKHHRKKMGFNEELAKKPAAGKLREEEQIDERNLLKRMKDTMRLGSSGKERVDRISGALSDRGGNWDFKKGDFTEKGKSQVKSRLKNVKGASDYALNKEETQVDEAAYSAKAARAGKDIGKPGKQFSKIAKSAGKRYGSEERGRKVAGAILARIRAKHMKEENLEELSAFGAEFAKQRAAGAKEFSFGGKSYTTAMKGQSSTAPSSGTMNRISPAPKTASIASQAAQASTIKQSGGTPPGNVKPNKTGPKDYPDIGNVAKGKSFDAIDKARTSAASSVPTPPSRPDQVTLNKAARDRSISDAGFKLGTHTNTTYNPSSPGQQATVQSKTVEKGWADAGEVENKARATGSFQQQRDGKVLPPSSQLGTPKSMDPVQGGVSSAPTTPKAAPTPPSRPAGLKESVQIGDYKYRIL